MEFRAFVGASAWRLIIYSISSVLKRIFWVQWLVFEQPPIELELSGSLDHFVQALSLVHHRSVRRHSTRYCP